jgi:hypothetical protein
VSPARVVALAAAAVLVVAAAGCVNPFQPATPEKPSGQGVVENFTTPDKLLQTMSNALAVKGTSGRTAYFDALAESTSVATPAFYAFHFPAVVDAWRLSTQRDPPNPWDLRLEKLFYDYLIGVLPGFGYAFVWAPDNSSPSDEQDEAAGTATYHRYYELTASSADGLINKTIAIGYADLYFRKLNGRWYLVRWEDRVNPSDGVNPSDPDRRSMGWRRLDSTTTP